MYLLAFMCVNEKGWFNFCSGLSKRFYLRASQIKVQRNNGAIVAAKLRNRQLRAALAALREKERNALGANDLVRMQKRVACLKDLHNRLLEEGKTKRKLVSVAMPHNYTLYLVSPCFIYPC